jgi:hypothetical protein
MHDEKGLPSETMRDHLRGQSSQGHSPVSHTGKCGFSLSATHTTAFILNGHERFCRFPLNMIGLEEIDPLIFSIRDCHFRKPFSPFYSDTDSITVSSE